MHSSDIQSVCIVRLSAIGDVTHVIPVIHALLEQQPGLKITWIIGSIERQLLAGLQGVEFIEFKKSLGIGAYWQLFRQLRGRHFDVVLGMQVSFRANLIVGLLRSKRKIGFDAARSKDLHGWFVTERINPLQEHVLDGFFQFIEKLGFHKQSKDWSIPIPQEARNFAISHLPTSPILAISPCSSHPLRNWNAAGYAEVADYACSKYEFHIVLLGGRSSAEMAMGNQITRLMKCECTNLIGKDTLQQLLAILQRCTVLITPDSGPAHMATCVGLPVIGLYAASNPERSGPYNSLQWCVNAYPQAAEKVFNKPVTQLKWGKKIEIPGVMDMILPEQVIMKLDLLAQSAGIMPQIDTIEE